MGRKRAAPPGDVAAQGLLGLRRWVKPAYDGATEYFEGIRDVVLCALQDARHHAVADEFPDRARHRRAGAAIYPVCIAWPQAGFCEHRAIGILRILAAGNWLLYPLEAAISAMGRIKGRAGRHCGAGRQRSTPKRSAARGVAVFGSAVDRIIAGAALARRYPMARIVYSGGNANLVSDDTGEEADYVVALFESLGMSRDRLILERRARNTFENAEFSKVLGEPKRGERWLLVTSANHMPRSVGLFRKAGFAVEPYPVNWYTGGQAGMIF